MKNNNNKHNGIASKDLHFASSNSYLRSGGVAISCIKCGAENLIHRHHITYEPEKIVLLCKRCHKVITNINTLVAKNYNDKTKLTNAQRHRLHEFFMANELWILKSIVAPDLLLLRNKKKPKVPKKKKEVKEKPTLKKKQPKKKKREWNGPKKSRVVSGPPCAFE